jgi:hypothetical protein
MLAAAPATAQYMWIDASGGKVFSDQPPPNNIPPKRILKQPNKSTVSATADTNEDKTDGDDPSNPKSQAKSAAKDATGKASDSVKKASAKDKELEAAKKKLDDEVAAKKKADEEAREVAKADNCLRAKQAKATLDSGARIGSVNAKGERTIMDEAARTVETKRIEGIMAADCKP